MSDPVYDATFFGQHLAGSLTSARTVLGTFFGYHKPASVVDVGCGLGAWLKAANELGVEDILKVGLDGDYVDRDTLVIPNASFRPSDLRCPIALDRRFDLAISVEVAEHLPYRRSETFVSDLTALSDVVLFSAALPYQGGTDHINEQWLEFWAILFQRQGYVPVDLLRRQFWNEQAVEFWYSQNLVVFCTPDAAAEHFPKEFLAAGQPLSYPHPLTFLVNAARYRPLSASALNLECEDYQRVLAAYKRGDGTPPEIRVADATTEAGLPLFPASRTLVADAQSEFAARDTQIERLAGELESARSEERNARLEGANWRQIAEQRQEVLEAYEAAKVWLAEQVGNWQQLAAQWHKALVASEGAKTLLTEQVANWRQIAEQRQEVLEAYEGAKAWLADQVGNWQQLAEQRQQALVASEGAKAWLEQQVENWQHSAEQGQQALAASECTKTWLIGQVQNWRHLAEQRQEVLEAYEGAKFWLEGQVQNWQLLHEEQGRRIGELEKVKADLENQTRDWRTAAKQGLERIAVLEDTIAHMRATRVWRSAEWAAGVLRKLPGTRRISNK